MSNFNKILLLLLILTFIGILVWYGINLPKRIYENKMDLLYSTINGKIVFIDIERGVSLIGLNNRDEDLYITSIIDIDGQERSVTNFLQVGDSIFSPYSSDSIYVIRDNIKTGYRIFIDYAK